MSPDILIAFCIFAFVASITPGPNNLMLLSSGMNFGFRASVPHIMGIGIGFLVMVIAVGLGLAQIFSLYPLSYVVMKWLGAFYLLYLAWAIATTSDPSDENKTPHPLSFSGAAAFQWVNPKAWIMAVSTFTTYLPTEASLSLIIIAATTFTVINIPCLAVWVVFGANLRRFLHNPRYRRAFNISMAVLLIMSLLPLLDTF